MAETMSAQYPQQVSINKKLCKACGICISFCPKVLAMDAGGKATPANQSLCTGCGICESHCPDFAISVGVN